MQSPPLSQIQLKDPTRLTQIVIGLLGLEIIVTLFSVIQQILLSQSLVQFDAADVHTFTELKALYADPTTFNLIYSLLFLVNGIFILRWIYRANANARQLGATNMVFTPGWSIGWYFVPFANLVMPYRALQEIWQTSLNPREWQTQPKSDLMPYWWFLWIGLNIMAQVSRAVGDAASDLHELLFANSFEIFHQVMRIPLSCIFLLIVLNIYRAQKARAIELLGPA